MDIEENLDPQSQNQQFAEREPQSAFNMAFFHFFGGASPSSEEAPSFNYLDFIKIFLQNRKQPKSNFFTKMYSGEESQSDQINVNQQEETNIIDDLILKIDKHNIDYIQDRQYGAMIIINQVKTHYSPQVYASFPTQWRHYASLNQKQISKVSADFTFNFDHMYIGKYESDFKSLSKAIQNISYYLEEKKKLETSKHRNPINLVNIVSQVLEKINLTNLFDKKTDREDYSENKNASDFILAWSFINFIAENNNLTECLMTNYRVDLLYRYIDHFKSQTGIYEMLDFYKKFSMYEKCLQEVKGDCQRLLSQKNPYFNHQKAFEAILGIAKLLKQTYPKREVFKTDHRTMGRFMQIEPVNIQQFSHFRKTPTQLGQTYQRLPQTKTIGIHMNRIFDELLEFSNGSKWTHHEWIKVFQDTIFTICGNQFLEPEPFKLFPKNILNSKDCILSKWLKRYCEIMKQLHSQHFSQTNPFFMFTFAQIKSHQELMKALIGTIGFQIYKNEYQNTQFTINDYRVPFKIDQIFNNFNSLSYKGRRAARALAYYHLQHKEKIPLFDHEKGYENFKIYGRQVGSHNNFIQNHVRQSMMIEETMQNELKQKIRHFHETLRKYQKMVESIKSAPCSCPKPEKVAKTSQFSWNYEQTQIKTEEKCQHCKQLQKQKNILSIHEQKKEKYLEFSFPEEERQIHYFYQYMNTDCSQLMKLLLFAQRQEDKSFLRDERIIIFNDVVTLSRSKPTQKYFLYLNVTQAEAKSLKLFESQSINITYASQNHSPIKFSDMNSFYFLSNEMGYLSKQFMSNPRDDIDSKMREHLIYPYLDKRPIELNPEEFIGIGSIKVSEFTQFIVAIEKLKKRSIRFNVDQKKKHRSEMFILWKSIAFLKSELDLFFYDSEKYGEDLKNSVQAQVKDFLEHFADSWSSDDFKNMPIVGPIVSLLFQILAYADILILEPNFIYEQTGSYQKVNTYPLFKQILDKLFIHYEGIERDSITLKQSTSSIIKQNNLNQGYLCFGGLCYFTEPIITEHDPIAKEFLKLIILYRFKEVFFDSTATLYNLMTQEFYHIKVRAIDSNIQAVKKYFMRNPNQLTQIIKSVEEGIKDDTEWIYSPRKQNQYAFKGKNQFATYEIDIKTGFLLINGGTVKRIPDRIKKNDYFNKIFGDRDFQVYPNNDNNAHRVNRNFDYLFSGNIVEGVDQAFFEFGYSRLPIQGDQVSISIIFRYEQLGEQQKWELVTDLNGIRNMNVPTLFKQNYLPWICQKRKCIIFRKPCLEDIGEVGAVLFYSQNKISKATLITNQRRRGDINILCDPFCEYFDEIVLREQTSKATIVYNILKEMDQVQYIIELQTPDHKTRKFWLHRYNLTCLQIEGKGLFFDNFKDYAISQTPFTNAYLPWSYEDNVKCIVLRKHQNNELNQTLHQVKVLMPYEKFYGKKEGIFPFDNSRSSYSYFTYDLHDHFNKLSGINRLSQLHLVAILTHLGSDIPIPNLAMTPIQCAVVYLYSCFNNTPLTIQQLNIIKYIQEKATGINETIILLCHALILTTMQLAEMASITSDLYQVHRKYQQIVGDSKYIDFINKCMSIYNWKIRDRIINIRNKIPQHLSDILGIKFNFENCYSQNARELWKQELPLKLRLKNLDFFLLQIYKTLGRIQNLKAKTISSLTVSVDQNKYQKECPIEIVGSEKNNILINEIIEELKLSYTSYLKGKLQIDKIKISETISNDYQQVKKELISKKNQIEKILQYIQKANEQHIDVVTRNRPTFSRMDFVSVVIQKELIYSYFPEIYPEDAQKLLMLIKYWMLLTVQIDSCQRILVHLRLSAKIDKTIILREVQSPRKQIQDKIHWVCFEVEMKIQIWPSQFQTYQHLMNSEETKKSLVSQLNMGQGKTQVIIPMIALQLLYGNSKFGKKIPRVNLLTSIFDESKVNYYRFFSISGFNIPVVELPFTRQTDLDKPKVLHQIVRSLAYFRQKMIVLVDQSSVHSLILKLRQLNLKGEEKYQRGKQQIIFEEFFCFDIFDEVDAQMTPKKSFIYSMGSPDTLDQLDFRSKIPGLILEIICQVAQEWIQENFLTFDQTDSVVMQQLYRGQFPKGLRLISGVVADKQKQKLIRETLVWKLLTTTGIGQLEFLEKLSEEEKRQVYSYLLDDTISLTSKILNILTDGAKKILYSIRGSIAHGIFEHCFSLRCRVNYGIPNEERIKSTGKRLAIPYEASDVPSKRNDFAQPDVAIFLTYLAYYDSGLVRKYFDEGIKELFHITKGNTEALNSIYRQWYNTLSEDMQIELGIQNATQIKTDSNSQMQKLFDCFKNNRKFIGFWLMNCVFTKDMKQYKESITSSSWDHSDVPLALGFSGTKDLHRLFPSYLSYEESVNQQIRGTDGKMLEMLLENTHQVVDIIENEKPLWQRIIETTLMYSKKYNIGSIIDVGATLAGNSLKDDIVPWIYSQDNFNQDHKFKGISFCSNNSWMVYQFSNSEYVKRGTTLLDHQTFVIFDEYRTRGADMKMNNDISAVLTLSPNLTKDAIMQAVGRLRKIGRDQKVVIIMLEQVKQKIQKIIPYEDEQEEQIEDDSKTSEQEKEQKRRKLKKEKTMKKVKAILNWVCMNSVNENEKFLLENSKLAKTHLKNKIKSSTEETKTDLFSMYAEKIQEKSVHEISLKLFKEMQVKIEKIPEIKQILVNTKKYGSTKMVRMQKFDEVLEREVQKVQQAEIKNEKSTENLNALAEQDNFKVWPVDIKSLRYNFSKSLKYSKNFYTCTIRAANQEIKDELENELQMSHFLYIFSNNLCMITIREAKYFMINRKIPFYHPSCTSLTPQLQYIALLTDLKIYDKLIQRTQLQQALVQCKFYNGIRNYDHEELKILKKLFTQDKIIEENIQYFLRRRRLDNYYRNSSLEKAYKSIILLTPEQIRRQLFDE